eukprot:5938260-Pleurochrysis_carterae.AAC.1
MLHRRPTNVRARLQRTRPSLASSFRAPIFASMRARLPSGHLSTPASRATWKPSAVTGSPTTTFA